MYQRNRFVCFMRFDWGRDTLRISFSGDIKDSHLRFRWRNVSVRDYDAEKQLWLVSIDERQHDVFDMYRPHKLSRKMEAIEARRPSIDGRRGSIDGRRGSIDYSSVNSALNSFSIHLPSISAFPFRSYSFQSTCQ